MRQRRLCEAGAAVVLLLVLLGAGAALWYWRAVEGSLNRALAAAEGQNDGEQVRELVARGASVRVVDAWGRTPLIWASVFGDESLVAASLQRGADVNGRAQGDLTALMWASAAGHVSVVRRLLAAGADVNARDHRGRTALGWAWDHLRGGTPRRHHEVIRLLVQAGARRRDR